MFKKADKLLRSPNIENPSKGKILVPKQIMET